MEEDWRHANYFAPGILGEIKVPILSRYSIIYYLLAVFPMAHIAMSQVAIIDEQW